MSDKTDAEYRIEWTGGIKVYHPIRPTVHATSKAFAVMCA